MKPETVHAVLPGKAIREMKWGTACGVTNQSALAVMAPNLDKVTCKRCRRIVQPRRKDAQRA